MSLFAKTSRSYGTNAVHVIFAAMAPENSRMTPVVSWTPYMLQRLISAGSNGIHSASLNWNDRRALADIAYIGLRLDRTRRLGNIVLLGSVVIADQRTLSREVA